MVKNSTCIKLKATDQELAVVYQPVLASGDVGTTRVEYELDSFWDGYALTGTFYASRLPSEVYEQPLTAGACVIPWEVLQDPDILYIGLRGVNGDGLVKTAAPVRYRIIKGSPCGTDTPMEPTPDVYQQLLAKTDTLERVVEESAVVCEASGETVTIADASDQPLRGLKLYGKSVQNGTPTPENHVEIESAVVNRISSVGANLIPFPYRESYKTANGITFTANADGSITISGTASGAAYMYLGSLSANQNVISGVGRCTISGGVDTNDIYWAALDGIENPNLQLNSTYDFTGKTFALAVLIKSGTTINNVTIYPMLNIGETARPYEPYKGGTATLAQPVTLPGIPVSSGGNYTDESGQQWICDEMDFARGLYVQRVGKVDLGTLNWFLLGDGIFLSNDVTVYKYGVAGICSSYDITSNPGEDKTIYMADSYYGNNAIAVCDRSYTDATAFKSAMSGVMLYYELATPVETPISETDLTAYRTLHTSKPNTTVYTDSDAGITVAYAADTKTYIDNKFAELAAAILQNA